MQHEFTGLSQAQAELNIQKYGLNILPEKKQDTLLISLLKQLKSPMIYILLVVAAVTFFLHDYSDSLVILLVVVMNAIIGTIQTRKANNILESLKNLSKAKTTVIRDGNLHELPLDMVTMDDYVFLSPGNIIPADGELVQWSNLQINESKINGESMPVAKSESATKVFRSTVVVSGTGIFKVTSIGKDTMIGQLSKDILDNIENKTILEKKLDQLTKYILYFVLIAVIVIFAVGIIRGMNIVTIFKVAISLAVSAIPEGLPMVITVVLAIGAWRISKVKGLLKNLPSGATLATVSYICTDKTGTLTHGDITVKEIINLNKLDNEELNDLIAHSLDIKKIGKDKVGDVLDLKIDAHITTDLTWKETKELPFTSENKYNAKEYVIDGQHVQIFKGAPELFLTNHSLFEKYVNEGFRVICVAKKNVSINTDFDLTHVEPIALVIFEDAIRTDVATAITDCKAAGVTVMMITGDNINTAKHVAKTVGILENIDTELYVTGTELKTYSDEYLSSIIHRIKVIARADPLDKLRIVRILQSKGEIVAMTGDGVNDGPSIALADIGIAMGKTGTEVAKEAADFILVTDSFSNIRDGIFEARTIVENIKKTLIFLLSTSLGEMIIVGGSVILGLPLPLLPVQILWLNLIVDGFLNIGIANERSEANFKKYNHKRYRGNILNRYDIVRMLLMATTMSVVSLVAFVVIIKTVVLEIARTFMLVIVSVFQWFNAINSRKHTQSVFTFNIFNNITITGILALEILLVVLSIFTTAGNKLLQTVPITNNLIILAIVLSLSIIVTDELYKLASKRK
jgi:Ca2+-transporting ATPase